MLAHHSGITTSLPVIPGLLFNYVFLTSAFTVLFYTISHTDLLSKYSFQAQQPLLSPFWSTTGVFHANSWLFHTVKHLHICFVRGNTGPLTAHHTLIKSIKHLTHHSWKSNTGGGSSTVLCYLRECRAFPPFRSSTAGPNPAFLILTHFASVPSERYPISLCIWFPGSKPALQPTCSASSPWLPLQTSTLPFPVLPCSSRMSSLAEVKPTLAMSEGRNCNAGNAWRWFHTLPHTAQISDYTSYKIQHLNHTHTRPRSLSSLSWSIPMVLDCMARQKTHETQMWHQTEHKAKLLQQFWHFSMLQFSVIAPNEG